MKPYLMCGLLALMAAGCGGPKQEEARTAVSTPAPQVPPAEISDQPDLKQFIVTRGIANDSVMTVDSTCIIAVPPTIAEADIANQEGTGEDFETAADDYAYYFSDVMERAERAHVPSSKP
jgi:hypothetical protein